MAKVKKTWTDIDLQGFLRKFPDMSVVPQKEGSLVLEGCFSFEASTTSHGSESGTYLLRIKVPPSFPAELPRVQELGKRIPKNPEHHINSDGSLCLGSRIRLLVQISKEPTLCGFAKNCLIPYLFAITRKLKHGNALVFGELAHGNTGELNDYADLLNLDNPPAVLCALKYLGMKKRRANKLPCPCGCGLRLGKCRFNFHLRELRCLAERDWFQSVLSDLEKQ